MIEPGHTFMAVVVAYALTCDAPNEHTASGVRPTPRYTVAADPSIPFGTVLHIEGVGRRVVQDRGSAITGPKVDLFMDSCDEARSWGRQRRRVYVLRVPQPSPESLPEVGVAQMAERRVVAPEARVRVPPLTRPDNVASEARLKLIVGLLLLSVSLLVLSISLLWAHAGRREGQA